jgi:putative transposase
VSLNRVIKTLGVCRSTVFYKAKEYPKRKTSCRKEVPLEAQKAILEIVKTRATYGTPRVRALLKRDYSIELSKHLTHRFMKENNLLIKRNRTRGVGRDHSGKIIVDTPNTRWASDITSIKCWNGEKVRLAVIIDCCDRSIVAWKAGRHMQASDIEIMVQDGLFRRFGTELPCKNSLEFLHDNGPEFIEKTLNKTLETWNIKGCNTPTYSPQSNGLCESFNGTLKRDYVYENCLDNPETVMEMIPKWIEDYNTFAPHSALGMKTPNEFFNYKRAA